jgi:MinD-like ATPase involved in chromosome partitioning or flagellar assembly
VVPDIALAASARDWPDRLHRYLLDHGGGRIVDRVMGPDQATEGSFDVLLIDDVSSFLTPRLVTMLKQKGSEVIGVFAPEDGSDAKRRLLECGISDVIETGASPEEFLRRSNRPEHRMPPPMGESSPTSTLGIAVTGPSEGVGMTEVAVSLASSLAGEIETTLVDLDPVWPSVAQRLDLPLHPNVRTAIDHALHNPNRLPEAIHVFGDLMVVGGRADGINGTPISRHETVALLDGLGNHCDVVVADLGPLRSVEDGLIREFDAVIVVGAGGPVGIARLIKTIDALPSAGARQSVLAIVNQLGPNGYRAEQTLAELANAFPLLPALALPHDRKLAGAEWQGNLANGARYRKAVRSMADVVVRSLP